MNEKRSNLGKWLRRGVAGVLSLMLVFSLIQPGLAGAEENYICGLTEHTHQDDCYHKVVTAQEQELSCALMAQPALTAEGDRITIVHQHGDHCYADGVLVCTLTEREAHVHTDACYGAPVYHSHSDACYVVNEAPVCGMQETAGHTHSELCSKELVCQLHVCNDTCADPCTVAQENHVHADGCYQQKVCTHPEEAAHAHTEACSRTLTCGKTEQTLESKGELTCGKAELKLHSHTEDQCYLLTYHADGTVATKTLNCDIPVVEEHVHTAACVTTREVAAENADTLTCGQEESEAHQHTERCYGTWELTCGLEEHVHQEACGALEAEEAQPVEDEAEQTEGTAWKQFQNPAVFNKWKQALIARIDEDTTEEQVTEKTAGKKAMLFSGKAVTPASDQQIVSGRISEAASTVVSDDKAVTISKSIAGTDIENVFDITLTVESDKTVDQFMSDPDMAVVIVMDISNTMTSEIDGKDAAGNQATKYSAAIEAATEFVNQFKNNTNGVSKLGYVAFNTDAHEICAMQSVSNNTQATSFINKMADKTANIVGASGYGGSSARFTNIEAGLKKAYDMLRDSNIKNKSKFILFMSDGLPTTYIQSGYNGYKPGVYDGFKDQINGNKKVGETNYSDTGAIKARDLATTIKKNDISIYAVGVSLDRFYTKDFVNKNQDKELWVNGEELIRQNLARGKYYGVYTIENKVSSTSDLQIGNGKTSFKSWLKSAIGSGKDEHYIDCNDAAAVNAAYKKIFGNMKLHAEERATELWLVSDPVPDAFEFIGFHSDGAFAQSLTGAHKQNGQDTVKIQGKNITWDLKASGYTAETVGNKTDYSYDVTYRVRLKNEADGFVDGSEHLTNGTTVLTYRTMETKNGVTNYSDVKSVNFPIPKVKGYLVDLEFTKQDQDGQPLAGAKFELTHAASCAVCRGDNQSAVSLAAKEVVSGADGKVAFQKIPSGHTYTLKETEVPFGYAGDAETYTVIAEYDAVRVVKADNTSVELESVTNRVLTAETTIGGNKTLTNPDGAKHTYSFELIEVADKAGNPKTGAEAAVKTVTFNADTEDALAFQFDKLIFKGTDLGKNDAGEAITSKTYYYKVSEVETDNESLDADEAFYIVEVVVSLNENNTQLNAVQTIYRNGTSQTDEIAFANTLLGELRITKEVDLLDEDAASAKDFAMKVTITGSEIRDGMVYTLNGEEKTVTGNTLVLEFNLQHNETAVIGRIPSGSSYTVEEAESSAYGYSVAYVENASGRIATKTEETPNVAVKVVNTELEDSLTLEAAKTIANPDGKDHKFTFRLTEVDETGAPVDGGEVQNIEVEVEEAADFRFDLHYQGTMLDEEPDGIRVFYYLIEETVYDDGATLDADETCYLVKVQLTGGNNQLAAEIVDVQKIDADQNVTSLGKDGEMTFSNTLLGSLTVSKAVVGDKTSQKFKFRLTAACDGEYPAKINGVDTTITIKNGVAIFWLRHGEEITIYGLPHGLEVKVFEYDNDYNTYYRINTGFKRNGTTAKTEIRTAGTTIRFTNYRNEGVLPQTGQLKWPILALAVLGAGFLAFGFLTKKRKRNAK